MKNSEKKIILVPHCLMTKGFCAPRNRYNTEEVLKVLFDFKIGIVQMPCPHLYFLMNENDTKKTGTPHCSDFMNRIKKKDPEHLYAGIINPLLDQIENYRRLNFEIAGLIGIKGSPVCGIFNAMAKDYGSFINILNEKLTLKGIKLKTAVIGQKNN